MKSRSIPSISIHYLCILIVCSHPLNGASESAMRQSVLKSLQTICAELVAETLIKQPSEMAVYTFEHHLPARCKRPCREFFIDRALKQTIGWKQQEISIPQEGYEEGAAVSSMALACSHDGKLLFSGSLLNGMLRMWDVDRGSMRTLGNHPNEVLSLVCTADGSRIFSCSDLSLREWDQQGNFIETLNEVPQEFTATTNLIACSADGSKLFMILHQEGRTSNRILELRSGKMSPEIEGAPDSAKISVIACSIDGSKVFMGLSNGNRYIWNRQNDTLCNIRDPWYNLIVQAFAIDAAGERCFSVTGNRYYDTWPKLKKSSGLPEGGRHDSYISAITCRADGKKVFTGTGAGTLYLSDGAYTMHRIGKITPVTVADHAFKPSVLKIVCSADGERVFTASAMQLTMWSNYVADLSRLDDEQIMLLFDAGRATLETGRPYAIDPDDARWVSLLSRLAYLQDGRLYVIRSNNEAQSTTSSSTCILS